MMKTYESRVTNLEEESDDLRRIINDLYGLADNLADRVAKLRHERYHLCTELAMAKNRWDARHEAEAAQLAEALKNYEEMREAAVTISAELELRKEDIADMQKKLKKVEAERDRLSHALDEIEAERDRLAWELHEERRTK